jgi:hypothetical protein
LSGGEPERWEKISPKAIVGFYSHIGIVLVETAYALLGTEPCVGAEMQQPLGEVGRRFESKLRNTVERSPAVLVQTAGHR